MSEELQIVQVSKPYKSSYDVIGYNTSSKALGPKNIKSSLELGSKYKTQSVFNSTVSTQNVPNARLMGISEYQSSNSLQNSSYVWSFTKSDRSLGGLYRRPITDSIYNIPEKKNFRFTSLGMGERRDLRPTRGKGSPPPNKYLIRTCFDTNVEKRKGPKILDKVPLVPSPRSKNPGPGSYNMNKGPEMSKSPITLKSRTMFFYDEDLAKQKHCISPQKYLPSTKMVENWRYSNISFGIGNRRSLESNEALRVPGPGAYNLPSVFDRNRRYKTPLN